MKNQIFTLLLLLITSVAGLSQGTTTSALIGSVQDEGNEPLIGANVLVEHLPTGKIYGTITDLDGFYRIHNMRVGGPYLIKVSYTGFGEVQLNEIFLRLGEEQKQDFTLTETSLELGTVEIVGQRSSSGQNSGVKTQISSDQIDLMPTLDRELKDFARLSPQIETTQGDGISIAGINNRYNAIYVDGAVNNDVFGLAANGANGGQTGITPFSVDIIDQIQVVISPYDVTLGGFAGGGINAVTKSGTNKFKGTAYYFLKNEKFAGKTPGTLADIIGLEDDEREKLAEFSENTYGFSLGGPIIKNKVHFFVNGEIQNDVTPSPFDFETYEGSSSEADLNNLRTFLQDNYNYDAGGFLDKEDQLEGLKFFGKVDVNLNQNHNLTLRHQFTKAEQTDREGSFDDEINFGNNGVYFPSITNSSALELNSIFGTKFNNNLIIGYTTVRDDRDPIGSNFPFVNIGDGDGEINFGSEQFSTANQLDQDILSITDNFKIYSGKHTFTIGTHNEFYSIYNLFIRQNFGYYEFDSVDDFLSGGAPSTYFRSYSLVDDITGDGSAGASDFRAMQLGLYVQDQFQASRRLSLTAGLRVDMPIITSDPVEDTLFNEITLPLISEHYDLEGAMAGQMPDGQLMFSPRFGFIYDVTENGKTSLRGGLGIFTSRIPFVWPGGAFNNNGLTVGGVSSFDGSLDFIPEWDNQHINEDFKIPSGQIDLFSRDFRYPQVFRASIGLDHELPAGIIANVEGLFTKTLNNVLYKNVNNDPTIEKNWTNTGGDDRPIYGRNDIDETYSAVYLATNTSEGSGYNLTAILRKDFNFGLNAFVGYTYGDSKALSEGTSSQNSSQWRGQVHIDSRNNPAFGRSDFSIGHRVISSLGYTIDWNKNKNASTSFSLFFNGQSGRPYSYVIGGRNARNILNETGSTSRTRTLAYIPGTQDEITLVEKDDISPSEQWELLNDFIENDPYLSENRGQYAEKNSNRTPFESIFDFKILQDLAVMAGGSNHKLQLSLDIFNVANLLNKNWGVDYSNFLSGNFNNFELMQFEGYDADGTTPLFSFTDDTASQSGFERNDLFSIRSFNSRWRMRLGVRYIFN